MVPFPIGGVVATYGDSIFAASTSAGWINTAVAAASTPGNTAKSLAVHERAVPAQQQSASYALAQTWIPADRPKFAMWKPWSPNDGSTAAVITADYDTYVAAFISLCHANGVIPVLVTSPPAFSVATAVDDNARKAANTNLLALADDDVLVMDADVLVTDGGSPARMQATYSNDGVHPNAAGAAVLYPALQTVLQNYLDAQ